VTARRVAPKYWPLFAENASPEAISTYLAGAHTERRSLDRYIARLEKLHADRTAQIEAGTWPDTNKEQL